MSKPLKLAIYEKHPAAPSPVYRVGGSFTPYAIVAKDKRFTDAELAAEFQFSRLSSRVRFARTQNYPTDMTLFDHYEKGLYEEWTLERFATLPHYDEETP